MSRSSRRTLALMPLAFAGVAAILLASTPALAAGPYGGSSSMTTRVPASPRPTASWSGDFAPKHVTGREGSIGIGALRVFTGKKVGFKYSENGRTSEASSRSFGVAWVRKTEPGATPKAYGAVTTSWKGSSATASGRDGATASGRTTLRGSGYTYTPKEYAGPASGNGARREASGKGAEGSPVHFDGTPETKTFSSPGAVIHQEIRRYGHANVDANGNATSGHITVRSRATTTYANGTTSRMEGKTTWNGDKLHHSYVVDGKRYEFSGKPGEIPKPHP